MTGHREIRRFDSDDELADELLTRLAPVIAGPPVALRIVLAVAAMAQLVLSLPWLVGSDPFGLLSGASVAHLTRDGALGLVIGIAGLVTAWRPRHAIAALLVAGAALLAQITTALIDDHFERVTLIVEAAHVLTVAVTALVAFAGRPVSPLSASARAPVPALRVVPPAETTDPAQPR